MSEEQPFIFVLMPFQPEFDELERAIKKAAEMVHCRAERVDDQKFSDKDIVDKIYSNIDAADIIVAVATGGRPNVFYEIGLAHAIQKHVILVIDDAKNMPFDLSQRRLVESFCASDEDCIARLAEEIGWCKDHPREGDRFYQEFKRAFNEVQAHSRELLPHFLPIANRFLDDWNRYTERIVHEGEAMLGPDRLKITRSITMATKKYWLIERFPEDPGEMHSAAWRNFYDVIGGRNDIEKRWTLCVEPQTVVEHRRLVKLAWTFFHQQNFTTRYLAPRDYILSSGDPLPDADVIENFGRFIKLLKFDGAGYVSGPKPDALRTTIRGCNRADDIMLSVIDDCSCDIDLAWIESFQT
jgi:nucleoside 2-deoxyribosyltransferase